MVTPLYCRKCGTKLPPESPFCPTCGTYQDADDQSLTSRPTSESSNSFSGSTAPEAKSISTSLPTRESTDLGTGRLPPGRILHNRYRLLQTVGQGGMGAVYLAQDTQLGDRLVAVKEMSMSRLSPQQVPQAVEQFKQEAHLLAGLHHLNLPVIYEYFGEGDRWYLVMSFIQGGSLQSYLDASSGHKLPIQEVVRIGIELCNVLDYLHSHQPQIIFRDLKPLNIMITPKGQIYLIDFGIARHFKEEQAKDTVYYYSVGYAPPEQYGQSQTGPRSDIYSLGATLYQMLTGHNPASKPFHFPSLQMLDPTIPVQLAELITQMLEMDEQQRPASVVLVKGELEKVIKSDQVEEAKVEVAKKDENRKQEKARVEKVNPQQDEVVPSSRTWQQSWDGINRFFSKWRIIAWIGFMMLNLIGVYTGYFILGNDAFYGYPQGEWLYVAGIGAVIGLIFLLVKGQFLVDILGGILLALLGNLVLFAFLSLTVAYCGFDASDIYINGGGYGCYFLLFPLLSCAAITLFISALLLLVGTRFFLRKANLVGGFSFGICLMLAGVVVANVVQRSPLYTSGYLPVAPVVTIPTIGYVLWLPSAIAGIIAIIATLIQRQRNKFSRQVSAS